MRLKDHQRRHPALNIDLAALAAQVLAVRALEELDPEAVGVLRSADLPTCPACLKEFRLLLHPILSRVMQS
jgi:hypothetical protein